MAQIFVDLGSKTKRTGAPASFTKKANDKMLNAFSLFDFYVCKEGMRAYPSPLDAEKEYGNLAAERVHEDPRKRLSEHSRQLLSKKCDILRSKGASEPEAVMSEAVIGDLAEISALYFGNSAPFALQCFINCLRPAEWTSLVESYRDCCEFFSNEAIGTMGAQLISQFGFSENKSLCRFEKECKLSDSSKITVWISRSWPIELSMSRAIDMRFLTAAELRFLREMEGARAHMRENRPKMEKFESALTAWLEATFTKHHILKEAGEDDGGSLDERLMKSL